MNHMEAKSYIEMIQSIQKMKYKLQNKCKMKSGVCVFKYMHVKNNYSALK